VSPPSRPDSPTATGSETAGLPPSSPGPTRRGAPHSTGTDGPLREIAVRSGAYMAGREVLGSLIRLGGLVVVVRQIGPSDFGIYSAAAVFVYFAATLAQMGAEVFLIRSPGPLPQQRSNEVFTFLLCTSLVVVVVGLGLSFFLAPWIRPVGVLVPFRVLLLSVPVNVLWAPAQAAIERKFAYRRMGLLELGGDVALYATAVPLALSGAGAWSLVAGYFAWQVWLLAGSLALSGQRPHLAWSQETFRALLRHGSTYALTTWMAGARSSIITLIVGAFAGAAGVGYINFAQRLVGTLNFTDRGVHRIGMVAISRADKSNTGRMGLALEEGTLLLMAVAALPFAAFGLVAAWVLPAVFGVEWLPALPVYVLLSVWAVVRVPVTVQRTLLYAYGRNFPPAVTSAIELAVVVGVSVVAVHALGIVGFGYATLFGVSSTLYTHHASRRLVPIRYRRFALPLVGFVPPLLAPVIPMPWAMLTLIGPIMVLASPSMRRELWRLEMMVQAAVTRGRRRSPVPAGGSAGEGVPVTTPAPAWTVAPVDLEARWPSRPAAVSMKGEVEMGSNGTLEQHGDISLLSPSTQWLWDDGRGGDPVHLDPVHLDPVQSGSIHLDPVHLDPVQSGLIRSESILDLVVGSDPVTGLASPGRLLARLGRLLGATGSAGWELVVVAVDVTAPDCVGSGASPSEGVLAKTADALRSALRFDDLVARVGPSTFVAVIATVPGGADGNVITRHLEAVVKAALAHVGPWEATGSSLHEIANAVPSVCAAHVVEAMPSAQEADQLVRRVVEEVRG